MTSPEQKKAPDDRWKNVISMVAEALVPTAGAEFLRTRRGSSLSVADKGNEVLTAAEVVGGLTVFEGSNIGAGAYATGKAVELYLLSKQKIAQMRIKP